jgi:hypothetical protein
MSCKLCLIPKTEKLLYEDELVYLVETKLKKGHKVRVMIVIKRHDVSPTFQERTKALFVLNKYMESKCDLWFVCDSTYATIPEHFHLVACDVDSTNKKEMEQLANTSKIPLWNIKFGEK